MPPKKKKRKKKKKARNDNRGFVTSSKATAVTATIDQLSNVSKNDNNGDGKTSKKELGKKISSASSSIRKKKTEDINQADIILLGVSRTSKTPTSIYLANRGYKTLNIPLVLDQKIPQILKENFSKFCVIGLVADPERLSEIRRTRASVNQTIDLKTYTDVEAIKVEVENSKKMFKQHGWPIIDVTRRSVEETAASITKIFEIKKNK